MTLWAHQHCLWSGGSCFQFNFKAVFSLYLIIFPKTPPTSSNNNNELCFMNYKALSHTWQLLILTKTHSPRYPKGPLVLGSGSISLLLALADLMSHCPAPPLWSNLRRVHLPVSLVSGGSFHVPVMTWAALELPFRWLIYALGEKKRWNPAFNKEAVKIGKPVCFLMKTISFKKWKNERLILKFISHCRRKLSLERQSFHLQNPVGSSCLPHWPRSVCAG